VSSSLGLVEIAPDVWAHPSAFVDDVRGLGRGVRIWHFCHVMAGARIGDGTSIGQNGFVASTAVIGARVKIQNNVSVYDGVVLEDDVFVGPSVVFTNVKNPRSAVDRRHAYRVTRVGRGASLGANATLLPGVSLGEYAFVGAGAAVTRDVAPFALVTGTPAREVGWVSRVGERLVFDAAGRATCPESGEAYKLARGAVTRARAGNDGA
jgi:UDP-2-acetamido-3-amino-2,3-dideoxy-glucuronate N-acetyltransferase